MRCLSLADALTAKGGRARFVCSPLPGSCRSMVQRAGHELMELERPRDADGSSDLPHAQWLGASQSTDAKNTRRALADRTWDWLVVDHYALDSRWESVLRPCAERVLVIDDLADRAHDCDALLDQNAVAAMQSRYDGKVPPTCRRFLGPAYALLRREFAALRPSAAARTGPVRRILILMGGMDAGNATEKAIGAVAGARLEALEVDVVVGSEHPELARVRAACRRYGYRCYVQTTEVPALMARADLAIGGCGTTSWERCCLGLPALGLTLAANQVPIAEGLAARGAIEHLGAATEVTEADITEALLGLIRDPDRLAALSVASRGLADGMGALRMRDFMIGAS